MAQETRRVVFADKKAEDDFQRLAMSEHPEDAKIHEVLQKIRTRLLEQHFLGTTVPNHKIPPVYQHIFDISNLWSLEMPPHGTVLYTKVGDEIRIVDIV